MGNTQSEQDLFMTYCRKRMADKKEFRNLFYEVLYKSELEGKGISHLQAFDIINQIYFKLTGKLRYKDYLAFCLDRIRTDNIKRLRKISFEGQSFQ